MDFFIVTPSYNQRRFLKQTVESVLNQKGNFTVNYWVFDGNSTDGSQQLLKSFGKKLQWQSKTDHGQADAINKGVRQLKIWLKATKKNPNDVVFTYLNSDDYYLPGTFEFVRRLFGHTNQRWLVGDCVIVDKNGKQIQRMVRKYKQFWRFWLSKALLGVLNPIPQPGVFIRASEILKIGLFDQSLRYVMDYDYWFKVFDQADQPLVTSRVLAAFRIHAHSKGGSQFVKQFNEQYEVAQRYTKNRVILGFHWLHNVLTVAMYRLLK